MAFNVDAANAISWFYAGAFGRTPVPNSALEDNGDLGGLTFWTDAFLAGEGELAQYNGDVYAIADFFVQSPEFLAKFPLELTNSQYVTALYDNMLGRAPDLAGFNFWVGRLNEGASRGEILADFTNTPENQDSDPVRKAALESFILFIANDDDGTITPEEAGTWLAANPTLDGAVVDNVPPVATDDAAEVVAGNPVTIDVLANDQSFIGMAELVSVTEPAQGTAEIVDGKIVYTTGTGAAAVGEQTFDYTIQDGAGNTATATVTVDVTNTAPVAVADTAATLAATPVTIDVLANDTDEDGHTLTIASTTTPLNGTVTVVETEDGQVLQYTPNADFAGVDQFAYTADDGFGGTSEATVAVTVAPPVTGINLAGPAEVTEGSTATYTATLSAAVAGAVTVNYAITFTGGATAADLDEDTPLTGTLTFPAGTLEQTLDVGIRFDQLEEEGEGIVVTLSNPTGGATLGEMASVSTALLDPPPATFTLSSDAVAGVPTQEGTDLTFTITPSGIVTTDTTLVLSLSGAVVGDVNNPASPADFNPASKAVTFVAGTTAAQTVVVTVVDDAIVEGIEGYQARLLDAQSQVVGDTLTGLITDPAEGGAGQTFTLTTATDNIVGTSGNDTIIAGVVKSLDGTLDLPTLTLGDAINGGAGTDRINLLGNVNIEPFNGANVQNVEQVFAQTTGTGASLTVSNNADVKEAWITNSTLTNAAGAATIGLTKAQVAGIQGNVVNNNAAVSTTTVNVVFTETTGTADAATIAVDNVKLVKDALNTTGKLDVTVAGIETLTIAAAGTSNIGVLTAVNASKLVVTGAGKLTAELSNNAAYKAIDASANTGGVTIDARAAAVASQVLDIKGGTGDDSYTTLFANLTKDDKIDLGAGNDKLIFADATLLNNATNVARLGGVANVEVLGVTGDLVNLTVDADLVSQSVFQMGGTGAFAGTNMSATDKLVVSGAAMGASTIGMKTGQTTTAIDLAGTATAAANASAGVSITGASTINLTSTGTAGVAVNKLSLKTDANGAINLTGAQNLVLTTDTNANTAGLSIQAGSFTGRLEVTGTAQNDIIVAGSAADIIKGSQGADTITLGAGADVVSYTNANQTLTDVASAAGILNSIDKIQDWSSADDRIHINGITVDFKTLTASQQGDITGAADLKVALDLAAGFVATGDQAAFTYGGNTYVFANEGAAALGADDYVIQLVGTHTLTAANITATAPDALV